MYHKEIMKEFNDFTTKSRFRVPETIPVTTREQHLRRLQRFTRTKRIVTGSNYVILKRRVA